MKKIIPFFLLLVLIFQSGCRTCRGDFLEKKEKVTYEIQLGDTLAKIAHMHDLTVKELLELNPDLDPRLIQTGDPIIVSGAAP